MGRPRVYMNAAEKHRAYRARLASETVRVDRRLWAALEARRDRLAEAVKEARIAGCPLAKEVTGVHPDTILDSLAGWFEACAANHRERKP